MDRAGSEAEDRRTLQVLVEFLSECDITLVRLRHCLCVCVGVSCLAQLQQLWMQCVVVFTGPHCGCNQRAGSFNVTESASQLKVVGEAGLLYSSSSIFQPDQRNAVMIVMYVRMALDGIG